LLKLVERCSFDTITPNGILRDRLIFTIKDCQLEKLLKKAYLTLADTDDICQSNEVNYTQTKVVEKLPTTVSVLDSARDKTTSKELFIIVSAETVGENMNSRSVNFALPGHVISAKSLTILLYSVNPSMADQSEQWEKVRKRGIPSNIFRSSC